MRQSLRRAVILCLMLSLSACFPWPGESDYGSSSSGPPDPPTLEDVARVMLEKDVYVPFSEDQNELILRRCTQSGPQHRCDLAIVSSGAVARTLPAYHLSNRYTTAELEARAEPLAELLDDMDAAYLTVRRRDVRAAELSAGYGSPTYRFRLNDRQLEVTYQQTRELDWEVPLSGVHFEGEVTIAGAYGSFAERSLIAFQIRHKTAQGSATSWVVFRRSKSTLTGQTAVIPSLDGHLGTIMAVSQERRLKPQPPPPATPSQPPSPSATAAPTSTAPPARIATDGNAGLEGQSKDPGNQHCTTAKDCPQGMLCQSPEEASWNACGAPREPACPAGYTGDSCGHCFQLCQRHSDCAGKRSCNGEGSQGFCISSRRCVRLQKHP